MVIINKLSWEETEAEGGVGRWRLGEDGVTQLCDEGLVGDLGTCKLRAQQWQPGHNNEALGQGSGDAAGPSPVSKII